METGTNEGVPGWAIDTEPIIITAVAAPSLFPQAMTVDYGIGRPSARELQCRT